MATSREKTHKVETAAHRSEVFSRFGGVSLDVSEASTEISPGNVPTHQCSSVQACLDRSNSRNLDTCCPIAERQDRSDLSFPSQDHLGIRSDARGRNRA